MENNAGFRIAHHVSRRLFPVNPQHPIVKGLDTEDLRDWTGKGQLISQTENTSTQQWAKDTSHGWRWGNDGSVCSAMIEIPHYGGWTPILQGEFDLAYTPLMMRRFNQGLFIWCTLDVIDRTEVDPVAQGLLNRLLAFAAQPRQKQNNLPTYYIGTDWSEEFLKRCHVDYQKIDHLPVEPAMVIIELGTFDNQDAILSFLRSGGQILFIPGEHVPEHLPLGFNAKNITYGKTATLPHWPVCEGLSVADLHLRGNLQLPLLASSAANDPKGAIAANGLLGRYIVGQGRAVFLMLMGRQMDVKKYSYMRRTLWHNQRTVNQLITNMNGRLLPADQLFEWYVDPAAPINLDGSWSYRVECRVPEAASAKRVAKDPGNTGYQNGWAMPLLNEAQSWKQTKLPGYLENINKKMSNFDGVIWYRKQLTLPENWHGHDLILDLGIIDDYDTTYFNGQQVGHTNSKTPRAWSLQRRYRIPASLVRTDQPQVLAVRVFDNFGKGGFSPVNNNMNIRLDGLPEAHGHYDPDYRTDFVLGDDPYRYYRW